MRPTRWVLNTAVRQTFGDLLHPIKPTPKPKSIEHTPPGYDLLHNKFNNELNDMKRFFKSTHKDNDDILTKDQVLSLLEKYITLGNNANVKIGKKLNANQRKLLLAAYTKANKKPLSVGNINGVNEVQRMKVGVLMKRNWSMLKYVVNESGIKTDVDFEKSNEEEIEVKEVEKVTEVKGIKEVDKVKEKNNKSEDFLSMLKDLKKVHQTPVIHVLPSMTKFEYDPMIRYHKVQSNITQSEIEQFEEILQELKTESDNRDENLFKASNNYEWSKNMMFKIPKTLESKTFFTPICVPNTLININNLQIDLVNSLQDKLRNDLQFFDIDHFKILKIYADGSSGILTNDKSVYWNGNIMNLYELISNLKDATKFQKRFNQSLNGGWIPVHADEREIVSVLNPRDYIRSRLYRISTIGISAIFGASMMINLMNFMI